MGTGWSMGMELGTVAGQMFWKNKVNACFTKISRDSVCKMNQNKKLKGNALSRRLLCGWYTCAKIWT